MNYNIFLWIEVQHNLEHSSKKYMYLKQVLESEYLVTFHHWNPN